MEKKIFDDKFLNKLFGDIMNGFLFNSRELSLKLDDVELKLPFSKEPIKLSGNIIVSFSNKKK